MPYIIDLTNGTFLTEVPDGEIVDQFAGLSLIGKALPGYGTAFNDNLVHMAENFADSIPPNSPLTGQIWYDTVAQAIKFYNGSTFKSISVITASATAPANPNVGDQWWDTVNQQLNAWSGTAWVLVGPISTAGSGLNGLVTGSVTQGPNTYYFIELYADNRLIGIIASDTITNAGITGFGNIRPGLNFVTNPTSGIVEGGVYNIPALTLGSSDSFLLTTDASNNGLINISGGNVLAATNGNFITSPLTGAVYVNSLEINAGSLQSVIMPTTRGVAGQFLQTNGAGNSFWETVSDSSLDAGTISGSEVGTLNAVNSGTNPSALYLEWVPGPAGQDVIIISGLDVNPLSTFIVNANQNTFNGLTSAPAFQATQPVIFPTQGASIQWNTEGGQGLTNFINYKGSGPGGFSWYNTADGVAVSSPLMRLDSTGSLFVSNNLTVTGEIAGGLTISGALSIANIYLTNGTDTTQVTPDGVVMSNASASESVSLSPEGGVTVKGTRILATFGNIVMDSFGAGPLFTTSWLEIGSVTSGTANGGSATLPANPVGFIEISLGGVPFKIPYYRP
jgi:hypothetical protein